MAYPYVLTAPVSQNRRWSSVRLRFFESRLMLMRALNSTIFSNVFPLVDVMHNLQLLQMKMNFWLSDLQNAKFLTHSVALLGNMK